MKRFARITAVLALAALVAVPCSRRLAVKPTHRTSSLSATATARGSRALAQYQHQPFRLARDHPPPQAGRTEGLLADGDRRRGLLCRAAGQLPRIGNELQLLSVTGSIAPAAGTGAPLMDDLRPSLQQPLHPRGECRRHDHAEGTRSGHGHRKGICAVHPSRTGNGSRSGAGAKPDIHRRLDRR